MRTALYLVAKQSAPSRAPSPRRFDLGAWATGAAAGSVRALVGQTALLPLEVFRMLAGALMALHFAGLLGLERAAAASDGAARCALLALTLCLAVSIALGMRARVCALGLSVVYCLASRLSATRGLFPATLDQHLVSVVSFGLMVLPVGRALRAASLVRDVAGELRAVRMLGAPGAPSRLFVAALCLLHLDPTTGMAVGGLATGLAVPWVIGTFPLLRLARTSRRLAVAAQLAGHAYLASQTGQLIAHALLAASALLWSAGGSAPEEERGRATARLDLPMVVCAVHLLVCGVYHVGALDALAHLRPGAAAMLAQAGLLPVATVDAAGAFTASASHRETTQVAQAAR